MLCHVRRATMEDYEAICAIYAQADAYHQVPLPHIFRVDERPARPREFVEQSVNDPLRALYVAEVGGRVVGLIYLILREAPNMPMLQPRRYGYVDSIAVLEDYRGQGIGHALMATGHAWARELGATEMELVVWEFNRPAQAFYASLGYETSRRTLSKPLLREDQDDPTVVSG